MVLINMVVFQSSNVDGHVDTDLIIVCSMTLTVRLVFNIIIKTSYEQHVYTVSSSLSCLLSHTCRPTYGFHIVLCNGHFASIIANIITCAWLHTSN